MLSKNSATITQQVKTALEHFHLLSLNKVFTIKSRSSSEKSKSNILLYIILQNSRFNCLTSERRLKHVQMTLDCPENVTLLKTKTWMCFHSWYVNLYFQKHNTYELMTL